METIVKKTRILGNSSGVLLPKEWLDKNVVVTLLETSKKDITKEVIEILLDKNILEETLGIYLVGSYARKDETPESDIDILVITKNHNEEISYKKYNIIVISKSVLEKSLNENSVYYYPMIIEAKPLLNSQLLEQYNTLSIKDLKIKDYIDSTKKMLERIKKIMLLDKRIGNEKTGDSIAYSLVLRLRSFYILDKIEKKQLWKKSEFLSLIKDITGNEKIYKRYLYSKKNNSLKDNTISIKDAESIIKYIENSMLTWKEKVQKERGRKDS